MAQRLGIENHLTRKPPELSGGEQQRVALARCLIRHRPFLLLDEPFSALDPSLRKEMLLLLRQIATQQKIGVLFISHQPDEARQIADRVAILQNGEIQFIGDISELDNEENQEVVRYLGRTTVQQS